MPTTAGLGLPAGSPRRLITAADVARLATVRPDGTPHVVPITYALTSEFLVTAIDSKPKRTANLQRVKNLAANPAVSVVVDQYADDWSALWWVRIDGRATVVEDGTEREHALDALVAKYRQYREQPPTGPVIIVRPTRWVAWSASDELA